MTEFEAGYLKALTHMQTTVRHGSIEFSIFQI
jgi:hypothetical protein